MKQILQPALALCLVAIIIAVACKKSSNNATGPTQSLNQLFSGLRTAPQNLSVQAGRDTIVFGADSTILHFYTNSFKDASGNIITGGAINIQLVEMYKPGDMVCNRTTTTANGSLLSSGGEINIVGSMNGQEVFANKYGIGFKQSGSSSATMELYYGGNATSDSVITWTQGNNSTKGTSASGTTDSVYIGGTSGFYWGTGYYYWLDTCTSFNWINCDLLYSNTLPNTTVNVVLPDNSFSPTNTEIFMIFPSINSITQSDSRQIYDASTNTFTIGNHENQVPVGLNYEIVVIANKNGSYYYCEISGVTTSGMSVNAAMAPESQGDIIARLKGL